eukprot:11208749-Lingulodinium_polyedra.AAC.1
MLARQTTLVALLVVPGTVHRFTEPYIGDAEATTITHSPSGTTRPDCQICGRCDVPNVSELIA